MLNGKKISIKRKRDTKIDREKEGGTAKKKAYSRLRYKTERKRKDIPKKKKKENFVLDMIFKF